MATLPWYFAPCSLGLEGLLEAEVLAAGGSSITARKGGVSFQGEHRVGYHLTLWSRVAIRVLEEVARGRVQGPDDLYELAGRVQWQGLLQGGQTLAVYASVSGGEVRHSKFAALRVKDAIVDQLRADTGRRPSVDRAHPDLPLKVSVRDNIATLSRDLAGDSLHRRGWRPVQVKSPLNEALAAGLLQLTGWDRQSPLCDPMCGSGTLLVEAAHLAGDRAPGLRRSFALQRWHDFDTALWSGLLAEAEERWKVGKARIPPLQGHDRHSGSIRIARDSAARAEVDTHIRFSVGDISELQPEPTPAMVVVNPPYGVRLAADDLQDSWWRLGKFLKDVGSGDAWVLSGDKDLSRHLRLKASQRIPVNNGGIDCRWIHYALRPREAR